jgi:signal transduction histidine kinase
MGPRVHSTGFRRAWDHFGMPRIDRRRLRTGLRLGLPDDPISSRGYRTALKVQLAGASAVLVGGLIIPNVDASHRLTLSALLAVLVVGILILMATVGRENPRSAWCVVTVLEAATILFGTLVIPEIFVPGLIAYTIIVAATTAIGGLGIGLLVSLIAAVAAMIGSLVAPGSPEEVALACGLAVIAYPTIALSIDGFTLNRHRAATQLARLHDTFRAVGAAPSFNETLDDLVAAIQDAFASDSAVVLLRDGDHLELVAPASVPIDRWTPDRIGRLTSAALQYSDSSPVARAMSRGETVVVHDIAADPRFTSEGSAWRDRLVRIGLSSMVVVPLRQSGNPVGLLHLCFQRTGALDDDELALLEAYADQATIVLLQAQAFAQLEAADAMKSEFLATVSHELRTPLTATKGFVDTVLLQWDRLDDGQRRQLLRRASGNADELARLIDQLLDYSRLDTGTVRVFIVEVELASLIDSLVARMAPVLEGHPVRVEVEPGILVDTDPDAFAHVLGNLLTNAANFSPDGSAISVAASTRAGCALVSVQDRGIGIAADEHERIFERFYRVRDDSCAGRGTGIGLAIAARFAELLGGTILVESAPGDGSTFSFTLPLAGRDGSGVGVETTTALAPEVPGCDELAKEGRGAESVTVRDP